MTTLFIKSCFKRVHRSRYWALLRFSKTSFLLAIVLGSPTAKANWDGFFSSKLLLGVDKIVTTNRPKVEFALIYPSLALDIGYSFSNGLSVFLEGQMGVWGSPVSPLGSIVASYNFLDLIDTAYFIDAYAIVGVGYGYQAFPSGITETRDYSGPIEFQFGLGVTFETTSWLDLGLESRLRIGVPDNPDVMYIVVGLVSVFKFPDSAARRTDPGNEDPGK